jgi:hypothetical protein
MEMAFEDTPSLWNPSAAANWSLLFTPIFGAYLQMANWEALGERERAAASRRWAVVGLVVLVLAVLGGLLTSADPGIIGFIRLGQLIFLFVWYFVSANEDANELRARTIRCALPAAGMGRAAHGRRRRNRDLGGQFGSSRTRCGPRHGELVVREARDRQLTDGYLARSSCFSSAARSST